MTYDAIVIGAGVNGLVAATLLARKGKRVAVIERKESVGGLCVTEEFHPDFRANTCIDDPGWMPETLATELGIPVQGNTSGAGATFPTNGPPVVLSSSIAEAANSIRSISVRDASRWDSFCKQVSSLAGMFTKLYKKKAPEPGDTSLSGLWNLASTARSLRGLGKRGMIDFLRAVPMPVADYLDEWFESDGLKGALAYSGVRNVRHGPMSGGTTLVFLHNHVGMPAGLIGGRRIVRGGVGGLTAALLQAAQTAGVEIVLGRVVTQITTKDDAVSGVLLDNGQEHQSTIVLSSTDVRSTFASLLDPGLFDPEFLHATDSVRMRGPALRMHLALGALPSFSTNGTAWPSHALRGTITLPPSIVELERAYDAAKHSRVADNPCLEVTIPSLDDPSLAPAGKHVMSVQIQFAAHDPIGGWTDDLSESIGRAALKRIAEHAPGIESLIEQVEVLTPAELSSRYHVAEGSLLHGELALDQFLFMRPVPECARHATPLPGLWLCGSSTHPGAGTAGASAWIAVREIMESEGRR